MDAMMEQQRTLMKYIQNFITNTNKTGKENITESFIQARVDLLENYWGKFQMQDEQLRAIVESSDLDKEYFKEDQYSNTEIIYCRALGTLKDFLRTFSSHLLQQTSNNTFKTNLSQLHSNSHLPKIQLPKFGGDLKEWPSFKDLFNSLIDSNMELSGSQKLYYLKTSLHGTAEQLVRNIAISDANYESAWELLCARFQNERLLVMSQLQNLTALSPMRSEMAIDLKTLYDGTIEIVKSLQSLDRPVHYWDDWLVFITSQKLDPSTRKDWENSLSSPTKMPTFKDLINFLQHRVTTLEVVGVTSNRSKSILQKFPLRSSSIKVHVATPTYQCPKQCPQCNKKHLLLFCPMFRQCSVQQRRDFILKKNLCFNCLRAQHSADQCSSQYRCKTCNRRHHTMLHIASQYDPVNYTDSSTTTSLRCSENQNSSKDSTSSLDKLTALSTSLSLFPSTILLATAQVILSSSTGKSIRIRALLDQGSKATFISSSAASYLELPKKKAYISVTGINESDAGIAKSVVPVTLRSCSDASFSMTIMAFVLPKLAKVASVQQVDINELPHLHGLQLADPTFFDNTKIDLLIGANLYSNIFKDGVREGSPIAQKTTFGWVLSGPVGSSPFPNNSLVNSYPAYSTSNLDDVDLLLQRFWEIEEVPCSKPILSEEEEACEKYYQETTRREADGRYVVRLPKKLACRDNFPLGESRTYAVQNLHQLQRRFISNPTLQERYLQFMDEYHQLNHMELISSTNPRTDSECTFYLPHHGVLKESSISTKLRVVFNGSRKTSSGVSLNECLAVGPKLQADLAAIALRWRKHTVVLAADIRMMYRQIKVDAEDCDLQRIVWSKSPEDPVQDFRLLTVTYGTTSAPYLAIRTLLQLADDEKTRFPIGSEILRRDFYVDDVLFGADDVESLMEAQRSLIDILTAGGFHLHKWASNSTAGLQNINLQQSATELNLTKDNIIKTLGLFWNTDTDSFGFRVTLGESPSILTKRTLLSDISKLYDPLGFLAPTIILAKTLFQKLWLLKLEWDTPLPDNIARNWIHFRQELGYLENCSVPRWIGSNAAVQGYEIHGFSDASETAYTAVVYMRTLHDLTNIQTSLLYAKTKLAPIKRMSIPRLELMGAHLLARLVSYTRNSLQLDRENIPIYCWTDSTTVLTWLTSHPSKWKTFIANRVSYIHGIIPEVKWRYVPTSCNPADCASRGLHARHLKSHSLWWGGPTRLRMPSSTWPQYPTQQAPSAELDLEAKVTILSATSTVHTPGQWDVTSRYSSLIQLLRITAWCMRFIQHCKVPAKQRTSGNLTGSELTNALYTLVRKEQDMWYPTEYKQLSSAQPLSNKSSILRLSPIFDSETKTIRVGGRLRNALLPYDFKHPLLQHKTSSLTKLIILDAHEKTLHGGLAMTMNFIRQRFWIPGLKDLIRSSIKRCIKCFRQRATSQQQLMGDLPADRVQPNRPFSNTGLDYAGPILVRYGPGRGKAAHKAYIALFVCMSTKAVHIELVSDMTTEAFLAAYRRFTSRRGPCRRIYSDNATTFVGAAKELKIHQARCIAQLPDEFTALLASQGTDWCFIPPRAPNFGGLWEAGVKSIKHHLRRVVGASTLTFEELSTLLAQIEACVNSRPLYPMSSDPDNLDSLTPGHFLIGSNLLTVPEASLEDINTNRLSRWQLIQQMYQHFWRRWSKDYLNNLQQRTKWLRTYPHIKQGLLVLIRDDQLPPSSWALGRISEIHPGADHLVRVVTVKTKDTYIKRPLNKLCILPFSAEADTSERIPSRRAESSSRAITVSTTGRGGR